MRTLLTLALAAGLTTAADTKDTVEKPPKATGLLGTWTVVSGEEDGKPSPEAHIKGSTMTVDKQAIKLTDKNDKQLWIIDYTVDESKTPKQITMTVKEGTGAGKSSEGIYEVDGDALKLCYGLPGADRPKEFKTRDGAKENCFVLKRVADKPGK